MFPAPNRPPDRALGCDCLDMAGGRFRSRFGSESLKRPWSAAGASWIVTRGGFVLTALTAFRQAASSRIGPRLSAAILGHGFADGALGGGFGAWGEWRVLMDDSPHSPA